MLLCLHSSNSANDSELALHEFINFFENTTLKSQQDLFPQGNECGYKFPKPVRVKLFNGAILKNLKVDIFTQNNKYHSIFSRTILINTVCYTNHSFGNDFGLHMENVICAKLTGVDYIAPYFMDPYFPFISDHPFFKALPRIELNSMSPKPFMIAKNEVDRKCRSFMFPWNQDIALIHSHTDIVKSYFLKGINSYLDTTSYSERYTILGPYDRRIYRSKSTTANETSGGIIRYPLIPDIAIHFRCSDNTDVGGILPLSAVTEILEGVQRRTDSNISTVYVVSEPPSKAAHGKASELQKSRCRVLRHRLTMHVAQLIPNAVVILLRSQDLFDDLARLTYAKLLICSASTFCLWAAISSNGTAHLPVSKLFMQGQVKDYGPHVHWIQDHPLVYFSPAASDQEIDWTNVLSSFTDGKSEGKKKKSAIPS